MSKNATAAKQPTIPALTIAMIDASSAGGDHVVNPMLAKLVLGERNKHNRTFSNDRLHQIIRDLKGGRWQVNGDTIKFDWDGQLLDGQHRLRACAESGVSLVTNVATGLNPDAQQTIDIGKGRSLADHFALENHDNAEELSAVARAVVAHTPGDWGRWGNVSQQEGRNLVKTDPAIIACTNWAAGHKSAIKEMMPVMVLATARVLLEPVYGNDAVDFLDSVITGTNLNDGDPALTVRSRMMSDKSRAARTRTRVRREDQIEVLMRGCMAHAHGRKLTQIRVDKRPPVLPLVQPPVQKNAILDDGSDLV